MRTRSIPAATAAMVLLAFPAPARTQALRAPPSVEVRPARPLIERDETRQRVSLDLLIRNPGPDTLAIESIVMRAHDAAGSLVLRRFLNRNGFAPSIETIPVRTIAPDAELVVFNPFATLEPTLRVAEMRFEIVLGTASGDGRGALRDTLRIAVRPSPFTQRTRLVLPLAGRVLVYDGNDFHSHHRRLDFAHPIARRLGLRRNSARYAYDLVVTDTAGAWHDGDASKLPSWHGFGAPVRAPAAGRVVAARDGVPDNRFDGREVVQVGPLSLDDAATFAGNHVVIDHGGGEYSLLAHLREGSLRVRAGDQVARGDILGAIGFSGSTGDIVHLHYELRDGPDPVDADGLPSRFHGVRRVGDQAPRGGPVTIGTGHLLESDRSVAAPRRAPRR